MVALPAPARAATPSTVNPAKPPSRRIWYAAFRMALRDVVERGLPGVRAGGRLRDGLMGWEAVAGGDYRLPARAALSLAGPTVTRVAVSELVADAGDDAVILLLCLGIRRIAVVAVEVGQVQREVLEEIPAQRDVELGAP